MASTLTWFSAGPQTKTGTTIAAMIDDLVSLINSQSSNADFKWEVASSNNASTPYYVVLRRKNGAAGRILIVDWTSSPDGNNAAILDTTPTTDATFICYFPVGTANTPSNLTAASGTIMGDDTGAIKCVPFATSTGQMYGTNYQWGCLACEDGVFLFTNNGNAGNTSWGAFAGDLVVDAADNAYACAMGFGNGSGFGMCNIVLTPTSGGAWGGQISAGNASSNAHLKSNFAATNATWYLAFQSNSGWLGTQSIGSAADQTVNSSTQEVFFIAVLLISSSAGTIKKGLALKLRQIAYGPLGSGAWPIWNSTGPTVAARATQFAPVSQGGVLWCTNFKV